MIPSPQPVQPTPGWQDREKLLDQFDRAWQSGTPPRIEDFLPADGAGREARRELLEELIAVDLQYRWRSQPGGRLRLEDYLARHPELRPLPLALVGEEYWVRQRWGDRPNHAEYAARFPQHQPRLHELLAQRDAELADEYAGQPTPPAPPAVSVSTMIETLRQYQLLGLPQLNELRRADAQRQFADSRALAKELLARNWLTPYQVNQLLQGRGGNLVLGSYLLLERLGEGGAGQVFKARHQKMNRVIALKLIRKELLADAEVLGRFYREIQIVSQLDHPNVVHAFDAGPAGPTHFLAMEYVEGTDLGKLVKQGGPLPVEQACEYIRQAALGLQHAHERGLVHRDIKPHNLILSLKEALIKVTDLGLARLARPANDEATAVLTGGVKSTGTLTPENAVMMGTLDYLSPEQALDFHKADIRSDIYSLGCTFYYLLTGARRSRAGRWPRS